MKKKTFTIAPLQSAKLERDQVNNIITEYQRTGNTKLLEPLFAHMERQLYKHAVRYNPSGAQEIQDLINLGREVIWQFAGKYNIHSVESFEQRVDGEIHTIMREATNMYKYPVTIPGRSRFTCETSSIDDMLINDDGSQYYSAEIETAMQLLQTLFESDRIVDQVPDVLKTLDPREQRIIKLTFGIECNCLDDEHISQELGLTIAQVRQSRARIIRKIRFRFNLSEAGPTYNLLNS